ncbi:uncharacterized protein HKW66_Vig0052390 [Vigna angularis]|uniref:Putative plant transposon protein domain-containing protein n=1 Tax=Phaseolus angularis TaxID=3914 RepID=A0A8T0L282_PHAAN|nr:uncharacterized protein HKW66_Vig0052390 [Vigna angularis]
MAEPSRRRRRRSYGSESTPIARGPNIQGWISDDGKHEEYLQMWKERKILRQKFVDLNWFTTHQFQFSQQLIEQGVQHLLQLQGNYYPDLVRVFYYNLKSQNGIIYTRVKGIDIILDNDIWTNVAHLPILENTMHVPNDFGDFNKILAYRSFMRNPQQPLPNRRYLLVGNLRMEERVLHYLIVWLLCPRGSNLAQCFEIDLMIMSAITQNIKINWVDLISDTIVRAKRYDRSHLPYPLLISLICVYKGVDVTGEKHLSVLRSHEIEESTLHQMGFIRQGNMFVRAEDDIAPEDDASAEEDEDLPMPHPTNVAGPSHPPQEYSLESISRQIADMASMHQSRMDDMMAYHALRYDAIDNHLKEIDDKLAKLYVPDSDDEP